ncbi:DUF4189 domain-containing protein [bacterium]|nr:DUF4189 domain-containing protein [bacterium]
MKKLLFCMAVLFSSVSFGEWGGAWFPGSYGYWGYQSYYPMHTYGSIAYSPSTGIYGFSYNHYAASQALNQSVFRCNLPDCRPVVWFAGACGSVAADTENPAIYGWAWAADAYTAQQQAVVQCGLRTKGSCKMRAWACSP